MELVISALGLVVSILKEIVSSSDKKRIAGKKLYRAEDIVLLVDKLAAMDSIDAKLFEQLQQAVAEQLVTLHTSSKKHIS